jgi:hypothetical protein
MIHFIRVYLCSVHGLIQLLLDTGRSCYVTRTACPGGMICRDQDIFFLNLKYRHI